MLLLLLRRRVLLLLLLSLRVALLLRVSRLLLVTVLLLRSRSAVLVWKKNGWMVRRRKEEASAIEMDWIDQRTWRRSSVPSDLLRRRWALVVLRLRWASLVRRVVRLLRRLVVPGHFVSVKSETKSGGREEREAVRVSDGSHRLRAAARALFA